MFTPTYPQRPVEGTKPVFGLQVFGPRCVTVPAQFSHWFLLLSLFSSFKAAATSKHVLGREVKCTCPPSFSATSRLDAM